MPEMHLLLDLHIVHVDYLNKVFSDSRYIYQKDVDKACFQYDMAYGVCKDLARRTASDKLLCNKLFEIASNPKYDGYLKEFAYMIYKFFDEISRGCVAAMKNEVASKQKSANYTKQSQIIRKFNFKYIYLLLITFGVFILLRCN